MATITSRYSLLPLGALALGTLASCSLPPQQAWHEIQHQGLIPYVASEIRGNRTPTSEPTTNPAPAPARTTATSTLAQAPTKPVVEQTLIGPSNPASAPTLPSVPPPSQIPAQSLPVAAKVDGLAGYVRSPFTNPPRLVDVRGMGAGSKVVCPYTRKPFLVPVGVDAAPASNVASAPAPAPTPAPTPTPAPLPTVASTGIKPMPMPQLPPSNLVKQAPTQPTKVAAVTPPPSQPPVQPKAANKPPAPPASNPPSLPKPAPTQPAPSTPAPAPTPAVAPQDIPMGTAIVGRPGFVNSPFAAKHQLVDVTGLPTGMEVKCPYTGKLFRVPPQASAPKN